MEVAAAVVASGGQATEEVSPVAAAGNSPFVPAFVSRAPPLVDFAAASSVRGEEASSGALTL